MEKRVKELEELMVKAVQTLDGQSKNIGLLMKIVEVQSKQIRDILGQNDDEKFL